MRWRTAACVGLTAGMALAGCTGDPDVVARALSTAPPSTDGGGADASATPPGVVGVPTDAGATLDAGGTCDFDQALNNADLPPELLLVAITCSVPIAWWTGSITGIDWVTLLEPLLGGTAVPAGEMRALDACDLAGVFYYEDPDNPDNVKLCPSVCLALQNRVVARSGNVGCTRDTLPADDDAGTP